MNRLVLSALIAGVMLTLAVPAARADDDAALYRKIMEEKSASIVTVKFLMKVHIRQGVQEADREVEREVNGILVGSDGLVLMSNTDLTLQSRNPRVTVTGNPVNFKIIFPDDPEETEHDAVLAATDSNLNLAFVAMKSTKDVELNPVDFAQTAKPEVAQELIGVARLARGFDFAPFFGSVRVTAKIAKPRKMYLTAGTFSVPAMVLFDRAGAPVGVMAVQKAASGTERGLFVLPGDVIRATIKQATESAKQVLAEEESGKDEPDEGKSDDDSSDEGEKKEEDKPGGDDDGKEGDSDKE